MQIGFIGAMHGAIDNGSLMMHLSLGRVLDGLAQKCHRLILSAPIQHEACDETRDYKLAAENIKIIAQPNYRSSLGALRHAPKIIVAYWNTVRLSDRVVIRGMVPLVEWIYIACFIYRVRPVHWLVGNPQALLKSHDRTGGKLDIAYMHFANYQSVVTRIGRRLTGGWLMCNGEELGELYASPGTRVVVSSTVTQNEIHERFDACQDQSFIRILFVGFLRPEKGLQYLVRAVADLPDSVNWSLTIVGTFGPFVSYKNEIHALAAKLKLEDKISWLGYIPYGEELCRTMRDSDVLVLPSLSEGTPRILIEARANGLPIIATNIGGIPTSVESGHDGILVPPKDSGAITEAIMTLHGDPEYALNLVAGGYATARKYTVERFVEFLYGLCEEGLDDKA